MSPAPSDSPRPRRRWLSVSLRLFMVLILVIACGLAWLMHKIRTQRQAIAAIQKAGGTIYYEWMFKNGLYNGSATAPEPSRLQRILGPELFETVVWVVFAKESESLDDGVMTNLSHFRDIKRVFVGPKGKVTGAMLACLEGLDRLEEIDITRVTPTDDDLSRIANMKSLKVLSFNGQDVTDAGLGHLRNLTKMTNLAIGLSYPLPSTKIANLDALKGMTALERLTIHNGRITSIAPLARLDKLEQVWLNGNPIDDAGVREVGGMKSLEVLLMHGAHVTDAGLASLASSKTLNHMSLHGRGITERGLERLGGIPTLGSLILDDVDVPHLQFLPALKHLESIRMDHVDLDDDSYQALARVPKLKTLVLKSSRVSELGVKRIAAIPTLTNLFLEDAGLSDAMLKHLPQLSLLTRLSLSGNPITDGGLANLKGIKSLGFLRIAHTQVTNQGIADLAGLPIATLHLNGTTVDDSCLPALKKLRMCRVFNLQGTKISEAGIKSLKKAMPRARILSGEEAPLAEN